MARRYGKAGNITVWLNPHKEVDDTQPYFRGKMTVDGVDYEVSLWVDTYVTGTPVPMKLSGQLSVKQEGE